MDNDTEVQDKTETLEATLASMSDAQKEYDLTVFFLLRSSERFLKFVENNFEIRHVVDHETQTLSLNVLEKPPVKEPFLVSDEMAARAGTLLKTSGVDNPAQTLRKLFDIFNGKNAEEESLIIASADDVSAEVKAKRAQSLYTGKLD